LLITAALFHDIGRDNDGVCEEHGMKSVEKMRYLNLTLCDRETAAILEFIVTFHCIGDDKAFAALGSIPPGWRERAWRLLGLLKDADGLDRVRIYDLDVRYLRNPEALRLERLAYELLEAI